MGLFLLKIFVAATVISFASWLSGKRPILAGFIVALPLTSILALVFSQLEFGNSMNTVKFAKSIFIAVPVSLLFFVPFLVADKVGMKMQERAQSPRFSAESARENKIRTSDHFDDSPAFRRGRVNFWARFICGIALLILGYFLHKVILGRVY